MERLNFRQWSNRNYAVFASIRRVIRIATLSIACSMLQLPVVSGQSDSTDTAKHYQLEEVTAVGASDESLISPSIRMVTIMSTEFSDRSSARSFDDLLEIVPGVDIRTRGTHGIQSDINIQGGSFDQSLVLFNGINVSDPQTGHFNLDLPVSLSQVSGAEILAGPSTRNFGLNAYSGAVNIVTDPSDSLGAMARLDFGQHRLLRTEFTLDLPFRSTTTQIGYHNATSGGYRENTGFGTRGLFLHSRIGHSVIPLELMAGCSGKEFGANAFYTPRFPQQYEETSTQFAALKYRLASLSPKVKGHLYWRGHDDHFMLFRDDPAAYENFHRTDVAGSKLQGAFSSVAGITRLNAEFRHETIRSTSLGEAMDTPEPVPGSDSIYFDHHFSRNHLSFSLNQTFEHGRMMIAGGAFFGAGIDKNIPSGIYPGMDLSFSATPRLRLFFSANRSMRLPTFTDLFYEGPQNRGNPDLTPESAVTVESGARYRGNAVNGSVSVYRRSGKETIDWVWENERWETRNITRLNTFGGSVSATVMPGRLDPSLRFLRELSASYSYTEISKDADAFISNYVLDNLKHKWVMHASLDLPAGVFIDIKTRWQDRSGTFSFYETPSSSPQEREYDPFWLIDVAAGAAMKGLTFRLGVNNLMNVSYRDIGSVIMPGRWITAGLTIRSGSYNPPH